VGKCGRKWPESDLGVQMPCNPVTLCRNLRSFSRIHNYYISKAVFSSYVYIISSDFEFFRRNFEAYYTTI
jgi:hypothetical protein